MKHFNHKDVNEVNSATWTACNNDSRSKINRHNFISTFGGEFISSGRYFKWQSIPILEPVYVPRRLLKFMSPDNVVVEIDHMTEYCKEHNLNKAAMYQVLQGTRKIHKGFTAPPMVSKDQDVG